MFKCVIIDIMFMENKSNFINNFFRILFLKLIYKYRIVWLVINEKLVKMCMFIIMLD